MKRKASEKNKPNSHHDKETQRIELSLMLPYDAPVMRFRDQYSAIKTALWRNFIENRVSWGLVAPAKSIAKNQYPQVPPTDWGAFLFKNPLRHLVWYRQNPSLDDTAPKVANYTLQQRNGNDTFKLSTIITNYIKISHAIPRDVASGPSPKSEWTPHGDTLFPGNSPSGKKWLWLDTISTGAQKANIIFTWVPALTAADDWEFVIIKWNDGQELTGPVTLTTNVNNEVVTINGGADYYSLQFQSKPGGTAVDGQGIIIDFKSTCDSWAHQYFNNLILNAPSMQALRMLGTAMKLTNVSPEVYKSGLAITDQIGNDESWQAYAFNVLGFYPKLLQTADEKDKPLKNGLYRYHTPSNEIDFAFQDLFTLGSNNTWTISLGFPLVDASEKIVFAASAAANQSQGVSGLSTADMYLKIMDGAEFETQNTIFDTEYPTATAGHWATAMEFVTGQRSTFDNPDHGSDIANIVSGVASAAKLISMLF